MIIDCPSCASAYHIARASLGDNGRKLRCAQCRTVWLALAGTAAEAEPEDSLEPPPAPEPAAAGAEIVAEAVSERSRPASYEDIYGQARPAPAPPPARRLPLPSAGFAGFVFVTALAMGGVAWRQAVVLHMPAAARLYAALGLPVNLRGLDLRRVTSTLAGEGPLRVLAVEGEIANLAAGETAVPQIEVAVRGPDARVIYRWTAQAPKARLATGESVPFRARLAAPPEGARDVVVRFAPAAAAREARR